METWTLFSQSDIPYVIASSVGIIAIVYAVVYSYISTDKREKTLKYRKEQQNETN